jgi:hypothetical protein
VGFPPTRGVYVVRDVWGKTNPTVTKDGEITATVPPHGTAIYRVSVMPPG